MYFSNLLINMTRSTFIKSLALTPLISRLGAILSCQFIDLKSQIIEKVTIDSIVLYKSMGQVFLVVGANGKFGITQCNDRMPHLVSLLKGLVVYHFLGNDAKDLPKLVDNAYRLNSNYKYAGMPLWNCIGSVEIACWDLLGKIAQKPVYQLLGKQVRSDYSVYISDFNRDGDVEEMNLAR